MKLKSLVVSLVLASSVATPVLSFDVKETAKKVVKSPAVANLSTFAQALVLGSASFWFGGKAIDRIKGLSAEFTNPYITEDKARGTTGAIASKAGFEFSGAAALYLWALISRSKANAADLQAGDAVSDRADCPCPCESCHC